MDEMFRAASETSTCISKAPYRSDGTDSPFSARFGVPLVQYYQQNPLKGARFARAMAGVARSKYWALALNGKT